MCSGNDKSTFLNFPQGEHVCALPCVQVGMCRAGSLNSACLGDPAVLSSHLGGYACGGFVGRRGVGDSAALIAS